MPNSADRLRERIRTEGPIPFAAFMEEALYGEAGYYSRPDPPIGEAGDFVTGASFSPLFGRATARLLRRLDRVLGRPADLFEAGFGTGAHLANVVAALTGDERRILAWDRIARPAPSGVERKDRLDEAGPVDGLIFSYELFDALPFHRLIGREGGGVGELWVDLDAEGGFTWKDAEPSDVLLQELLGGFQLEPGQIADLAPGWVPLYKEIAGRLGRGLLVTCDYGFERERLLDVRIRRHGTLACFTRQRVHRNPFVLVGEQDLTAHVDFTALIRAGEEAGLTTVALTRQALWLTACGLFDDLQDAGPEARQQAMALLDGEGMGEDIRVLIQAKGIDAGDVVDLRMLGQARTGAPKRDS
jgi:SAM-dependent MidA family methyltransferase